MVIAEIAEELYRRRTGEQARSAGTKVRAEKSGVFLKDDGPLAENAVSCLLEITGIDLSFKQRTGITKELCIESDKIIIMAERRTLPYYLDNYKGKTLFWEINDPKHMDLSGYKEIVRQIEKSLSQIIP